MALNIIDLVKGQLGPALVSQTATKFGESESSIFKGITAFLPILMGKLTDKVENSDTFNTLIDSSKSGILGHLLNLNSDNTYISKALPTLLNEKEQNEAIKEVSKYANINEKTSQSLLVMVTGAILGGVGKHAIDNKLNASELANVLANEKSKIILMIPSGISADKFGLKDDISVDLEKTSNQTQVEEKKIPPSVMDNKPDAINEISSDNGGSILKWLIPLILILIAGYFLFKQYNQSIKANENENLDSKNVEVVIDSTTLDNSIESANTIDSTSTENKNDSVQ